MIKSNIFILLSLLFSVFCNSQIIIDSIENTNNIITDSIYNYDISKDINISDNTIIDTITEPITPKPEYIRQFENKLRVKGYLGKKSVFINKTEKINGKSQETDYEPNNPANIGVKLSWNRSVISFGYDIGLAFMANDNRVKTKSSDFQYHIYAKKFVIDLIWQKYKGFYYEDKNNKRSNIMCPDLQLIQFSLSGQYVFNNKKFSYPAAFEQNEKQLISAGSFISGVNYFYTKAKSDSSFVFNNKHDIKNYQFGISAGYAYTFVFKKGFFINTSATVGLNLGNGHFNIFKQEIKFYPSVLPRISVGFNRETYGIGLSFVSHINFPSFSDNSKLGIISGNIQLSYVHRFKAPKFLRKEN